jgi:hypothetical protein
MRGLSPVYRPTIAVDIERSAGRGDTALVQSRAVLADVMRGALEESDIDWSASSRTTHGDMLRVIAPAGTETGRLIYPLLHNLSTRLRLHNQTAGRSSVLRVRAAVHAGGVHIDEGEVVGSPLELVSRLLDAPPLKAALASAPEHVTTALVVSAHVHDEVVRHGYRGIDPATFSPVEFTVKETTATAWLHVPGWYVHPAVGAPAAAPNRNRADKTTPPAVRAQNLAMGNARVGQQVGHIGTQIGQVGGNVTMGPLAADPETVGRLLAELKTALQEMHRAGSLDKETYAAADIELRVAEQYSAAKDEKGRARLLMALRKLRAALEDVTDLGGKIAALITAVRGL